MLTNEMPVEVAADELEKRVALGWLHDILEDGKKEDGSPVTMYDLQAEGVPMETVDDVLGMSHETWQDREGQRITEPKIKYLTRLSEKSLRVKFVKCVDRICNLREGKEAFKERRWLRYVGETYYFIFPLTEDLPDGAERGWLQAELVRAVQARTLRMPPLHPSVG